jgi:hypothetical protein
MNWGEATASKWRKGTGETPVQLGGGRTHGRDARATMAGRSVACGALRGGRFLKHVFLRNEPTVFGEEFSCIHFVVRRLCGLLAFFSVGSFWKTNPPEGCF